MSIYPDAIWSPGIGGGGYLGGPWRIVWQTAEVATASEAIGRSKSGNSWPHFTVDAMTIYQHFDTDVAARSLEGCPGGVETNRWHAILVELVAHAAWAKPADLIAHAARLARWIERTHGVPQSWPNGYPLPGKAGKDPGGHNRNAAAWKTRGGHYGRSQVPGNSHWGPGILSISALMAPDPPGPQDAPEAPGGGPET